MSVKESAATPICDIPVKNQLTCEGFTITKDQTKMTNNCFLCCRQNSKKIKLVASKRFIFKR